MFRSRIPKSKKRYLVTQVPEPEPPAPPPPIPRFRDPEPTPKNDKLIKKLRSRLIHGSGIMTL